MADTTLSKSEIIALNEQLTLTRARHQAALDSLATYSREIDESTSVDELALANTHYENALETVAEYAAEIQEITDKLGGFVELSSQKLADPPPGTN